MKEFKRKLQCKVCNQHMYCKDRKIYQIVKDAWEWEHEECNDMQYIMTMKVSIKGGDSTWIL